MNIYQRLRNEHRLQLNLADRILAMDPGGDRSVLFIFFCREVIAHSAAEEVTFCAALLEHRDVEAKTREALLRHQEFKNRLNELQSDRPDSNDWSKKFRALTNELKRIVEAEELTLFSHARERFDDVEARKLAEYFDERKSIECESFNRWLSRPRTRRRQRWTGNSRTGTQPRDLV